MWMRYVVRAILVVGLLVGAYYTWRSQKEKEEASQEAIGLAKMITTRIAPGTDPAPELYKILAHFHRTEALGKENKDEKSVWTKLSEGLDALGEEDPAATKGGSTISRSIRANYETAEKCGAFDTEMNVSLMESGKAPLVLKGSYYDPARNTPLAVAHVISPIFAPESATALPNLKIVPEPVALMRIEEIDGDVIRTANDLKSMGALTADTMDLLRMLEKKDRE